MGLLEIIQGMGRGSFSTKSRRTLNKGRSENMKRLQNARRVRALGKSDREMANRTEKRFQHDASHGAGDEDEGDYEEDAILVGLEDKTLKDILMEKNKESKKEYPALPGNLYKKWAFFGIFSGDYTSAIGQIFIFIIQSIAPLAMLIYWVVMKIDWSATKFSTEHWTGSDVHTSEMLTTFIKVLFMFLFYLNAVNSNSDEEQNWKNTKLLFEIVGSQSKEGMEGSGYLWLGSFVNCQALIFLCVDTWLLMYNCSGPGDVVMNIVGLIFMYKMDDQDSDLVFFGEDDWNADVMGDILGNSLDRCDEIPYDKLDDGFDAAFKAKYGDWDTMIFEGALYQEATDYAGISNPIYTITGCFAYLAALVLPAAYLFVKVAIKS